MKIFYPACNDLNRLSPELTALKIARHSPCTLCSDCHGLHPPSDLELVRDDRRTETSLTGLAEYGSDDEEEITDYLQLCGCGHNPRDHGANDAAIDHDEYVRRATVAIRLEEHLERSEKLLDFGYSDEEVVSLRREMQVPPFLASPLTEPAASPVRSSPAKRLSPAVSQPSEDEEPLAKRRRLTEEDADEDEEEDQPLALITRANVQSTMSRAENAKKSSGRRGGKTAGMGMKSKAHVAPISIPPPTGDVQAEMNGELPPANGHGPPVKVEEQMDEDQLDRLVTGVTVDTEGAAPTAPKTRPEKPSAVELRRGVIQIVPVENDGQPRSLIILTNLKTLFQKQLPVMPREYIARLVLDNASKSLAICKRGYKVVGGICYRPFPHRGFAEIVFFATASADQEKGYGGMLMDHFKAHIRRTYPDMMHFLTYADNFAVGYFRKQGFSKDITLDRAVWAGYIKDYEGGTIMQCSLFPRIDYLNTREIIAQQREAILSKIREMSKSHVVYPGLPQFQDGAPPDLVVDPKDVPGLRESGWTPDMVAVKPANGRSALKNLMERILNDMMNSSAAWPFRAPVNKDEVLDYYDVIEEPMDLSTMQKKLEKDEYPTLEAFKDDAQLIWDNCRYYNPEDSIYCKQANKLEEVMKESLQRNGQKP